MIRLIVLIVLSLAAVGIAFALQRRKPEAPSAPSYRAPRQLDRSDFDVPSELDLVVVFASSTCDSCPQAWATVTGIEHSGTGAQRVLVQERPDLHKRYKIDGVPTTLVVGPDGAVHASFFGVVDAAPIIEALESIRD